MPAKPVIKRYSLDELKKMRGTVRPDAPIRPVPKDFWKHARVVFPPAGPKVSVHMRLDRDVLAWFRAQGPGHMTRMNAVLRSYYEAERSA
jgi:uncharacterized protein (DUF4415 family)